MLTVWGRRSSFNLQKVLWLVGELGIEHRHIQAGGQFGGLDTPEFRGMNPVGRVPVINDEGTIVWESHAILRYLAACYGGAWFWPDDPAERSQADRWMDWSQTALQPDFVTGVFWGLYRTPEPQRNWSVIRDKIARCAQHFQLLDNILGDRPLLCGDSLSLGDLVPPATTFRLAEGLRRGRAAVAGQLQPRALSAIFETLSPSLSNGRRSQTFTFISYSRPLRALPNDPAKSQAREVHTVRRPLSCQTGQKTASIAATS